jgi:hypothetical protein
MGLFQMGCEGTEGRSYLAEQHSQRKRRLPSIHSNTMRTYTLFVALCLGTFAVAQSWCPPGAVWLYRFTAFTNIDFRVECRYLEDTVIAGVDAHVIQEHSFGTSVSPSIDEYRRIYERVENNVIYSGTTVGDWDTLYWFGQVGDRWWPIGHPQTCPPHGMLEIVATGQTAIGGITLQQVTVVTIDEEGEAITPPMQITERLGMVPRHPHWFVCGGVIDYFQPHFLCYIDEEVQVPKGEECHLTIGTPEIVVGRASISLHPNPGTTFFQLTGLGQLSAELRLLDLQGRVVTVQNTVTSEDRVQVSTLPAGAYMVEAVSDLGRQVLRWVKD